MRIVIAPDSFKGTATAVEVAEQLAAGWRTKRPGDDIVLLPMADGGEGTLDAFEVAVPGARRIPLVVDGPDSRPLEASWLLLPDGTAVVELAETSGITLMRDLRPLVAHARGFGQAIASALDAGATRLLLAIGGSASSDGGASVLAELGARLLDASGAPIGLGNNALADLASLDLSALRALPAGGAIVLADVVSPLLGPTGAVAVFGAQKGADATTGPVMEANLAHLAEQLGHDPADPGSGAAGGVGYALLGWGARFSSGAAAVGEALGVEPLIASSDYVITGEGRFDEQSSQGKVPSYVRDLATLHGVPAALVAGVIGAPTSGFAAATSLSELAGDTTRATAETPAWLRAAGAALTRGM